MSGDREVRLPQGQGPDAKPGAVADARGLALHLERMALMLRGEAAPSQPSEAPGEKAGPGWWVLAQGEVLDDGNFEAREAARERLLAQVRRAGLLVEQNVWVWDETWRAQLVLATLPSQARAWRVAERLREKGLTIRVRREMPEKGS